MFRIGDMWYSESWYIILYGTLYHITKEGLVPIKEVRESHIERIRHEYR